MKIKQIVAAVLAPVAVLVFAVGVSVLTRWLENSPAGKYLMLAVLPVLLVAIGRMAWVIAQDNDADKT